jgi:hypothetical protein
MSTLAAPDRFTALPDEHALQSHVGPALHREAADRLDAALDW